MSTEWTLALHIISVIAWMAGMLYLPRLYAYHAAAEPGSDQSQTFKVMERRLLRGIINPAMISACDIRHLVGADARHRSILAPVGFGSRWPPW